MYGPCVMCDVRCVILGCPLPQIADGASVLGGFGFQGYNADGTVVGWDGVRLIDQLFINKWVLFRGYRLDAA